MKSIVLLIVFSLNAFASTMSEGDRLFSERGADVKNAMKAADLYKKAADETRSNNDKGVAKYKEAQALYYFGSSLTSKEEKKKLYTRAYLAGEASIKVLSKSEGVPAEGISKTDLALAHYFYSINLARWGVTNGISASIKQLPKLMKNLDIVNNLDESVEDFGALRTTGRTKYKVPAALARLMGLSGFSTEDAYEDLMTGYEETIEYVEELDVEISRNATTVNYLLDVLAALGERGEFCDIFLAAKTVAEASDEIKAKINPNKIPETKKDYKNLMRCVADKDDCEAGEFESGKDFHELANACL